VCVSVQRIYVHKSIARDFAEKLTDAVLKIKVGDPTLEDTEVGPLIRNSEVNRVEEWINEANKAGAEIMAGGKRISESCYEPTVLYDPPDNAKVSTLEIFGPVICIYPYEDIDDAIKRSNALPYAFQASVFTKDLDSALYASSQLDASAILINDHTAFRVDWMPFAGLKHSGKGIGGIPYTMKDMQVEKMIVFRSKGL
ncbi:aldehyde dehydrogenase family protein, partial [candidate division KSB1 bacterium]